MIVFTVQYCETLLVTSLYLFNTGTYYIISQMRQEKIQAKSVILKISFLGKIFNKGYQTSQTAYAMFDNGFQFNEISNPIPILLD